MAVKGCKGRDNVPYTPAACLAHPIGKRRLPIHLILVPAASLATLGGQMGQPSRLKSTLLLLTCVAGIYVSYLTQGVVQETLSTKQFGANGARFGYLSSLNAVQCWVCFLWAALLLVLFDKR